jgi:hypothetical protein
MKGWQVIFVDLFDELYWRYNQNTMSKHPKGTGII